jgi:hypothetical protein
MPLGFLPRSVPIGFWVWWLWLLPLSAAPAAFGSFFGLKSSFETHQYPTGYLPAELVFLAQFNDNAPLMPLLVFLAGVYAAYNNKHWRLILGCSTVIVGTFITIYLLLTLFIISMYLNRAAALGINIGNQL